jgi:hypothetical protein
MPKVAAKTKDVVEKYVREFSSDTFKGDGGVLYCVCCDQLVSTTTRFLVMQHINTAKHKENKERRKSSFQQTFITQTTTSAVSGKSGFDIDLCCALVQADIPFHKVSHPEFKGFFWRNTRVKPFLTKLPSENLTWMLYTMKRWIKSETLEKMDGSGFRWTRRRML